MIEIRQLQKSFGRQRVLQSLDLDISEPGIVAVLGPNGSGKTTLIKSILGMVLPESGSIKVNGTFVKGNWSYRNDIGYLPQIARFPENLKVMELVNMLKDLRRGASRDKALIETFGLQPYLNKKLGHLSGGTKQKVNIVLAMMYDSPLLFLDEPTAGLDPIALVALKDLLKEERQRGKTILLTTHIMSLVEQMADELVFLLEGSIRFRGTPNSLMERHGEADLERAIAKTFADHIQNDEAVKGAVRV